MTWGSEEDWARLYHPLVMYARARCLELRWRKHALQNLPRGHSPETIVHEAVCKSLDGDRDWNHEKYPGENPFWFLLGVIDSIIDGLIKCKEHRSEVSLEDECGTTNDDGEIYRQDLDANDCTLFSPPISDPEMYTFYQEIDSEIRACIADDTTLVTLYEHLRAGRRPREIAEAMGLSREGVYLLIRRFLRRTRDIFNLLFGDAHADGDDKDDRDDS